MHWEAMLTTVKNCLRMADKFGRTPYFYLTGGDPILHGDFWRLLKYFKRLRIDFTIMGNPFHLNTAVCKQLKDCGCIKYQLSLDGLRKTHDFIRKPGSFDCTISRISMLNKAGIVPAIMTTVSELNIAEIPELIDVVVEHGAGIFAFARFCPNNANLAIAPAAYRNFLERCDAKFKKYEQSGCNTWFNKKDHLWKLYEYERGEFKIPENCDPELVYEGCNCGNCHLTILPDGQVLACRRVRGSQVGNVFKDDLADLWLHGMEKFREYQKFKKCSRCELLSWCRGCPAVASSKNGDFYDTDPQCWKNVL